MSLGKKLVHTFICCKDGYISWSFSERCETKEYKANKPASHSRETTHLKRTILADNFLYMCDSTNMRTVLLEASFSLHYYEWKRRFDVWELELRKLHVIRGLYHSWLECKLFIIRKRATTMAASKNSSKDLFWI